MSLKLKYTLDPHGRAALVYVERADGAVLSVFNRKYHVWGLPGGKVNEDENVVLVAARELFEETGSTVRAMAPMYKMPTYSGSGHMCYVFRATEWEGHVEPQEVDGGVGWMSEDFLRNAPVTGPWFTEFFNYIHAIGAGLP